MPFPRVSRRRGNIAVLPLGTTDHGPETRRAPPPTSRGQDARRRPRGGAPPRPDTAGVVGVPGRVVDGTPDHGQPGRHTWRDAVAGPGGTQPDGPDRPRGA